MVRKGTARLLPFMTHPPSAGSARPYQPSRDPARARRATRRQNCLSFEDFLRNRRGDNYTAVTTSGGLIHAAKREHASAQQSGCGRDEQSGSNRAGVQFNSGGVTLMITGVHTMFYTSEPEALRAFLRDRLGFPYTDVGEGWLIFNLPEADMGCHPADPANGQPSGTPHISFYCDDLEATIAELKGRGVEFVDEAVDAGYGLVTHFRMPGNIIVQLYQPRYSKG